MTHPSSFRLTQRIKVFVAKPFSPQSSIIQQQVRVCFEQQILGEHPFWQGGGMVYGVNQMNIRFFIASIPSKGLYSIILFFKSILVENIQGGNKLNQFRPSNSNEDLCLLFCRYPSSMECNHCNVLVRTSVNFLIYVQELPGVTLLSQGFYGHHRPSE